MYSFWHLLWAYLLGGLTFIPLLIFAILLHAYLTFPTHDEPFHPTAIAKDALTRPGDDEQIFRAKLGDLPEKNRSHSREPDVAAGYFAVCREYVPGGINGKPPERTTPTGETVPAESPSVYQTVYRSIFDRNKALSLDNGKGNVKTSKKARNVFFVVLRHGHLMLYDDSEQIEVRYVISLAHHDIGIYAGGENIPEGELFIRRNAISLTRKEHSEEIGPDTVPSKPFYLFTENCSEKEDFYYALLQSHEWEPSDQSVPLKPQLFEVKDIISLVQRLHSSEEHLQTRWVNALAGRLFLALYKMPETELFVRNKIAKKISRVKIPTFLSDIAIRKIDMGSGALNITNPRLKDLNVDGECSVEADITYAGNFRIEIATTARIDLGTRFKAREVSLVLAVVLKKLDGHAIIRFKAPPSNRVWFAFETMPKMEMTIEPIVSSRQITYNVILRAIESRIREVMAETLVLPHWDDIPFTNTSKNKVRGGIWDEKKTDIPESTHVSSDQQDSAQDHHEEHSESSEEISLSQQVKSREKTMSMPVIRDPSEKHSSSISDPPKNQQEEDTASSSGYQSKSTAERRRPLRSTSFASLSGPTVSTSTASADVYRPESRDEHEDATSAMMRIRSKSQPGSPMESPVGSPPQPSIRSRTHGSQSSDSSKETMETEENKSIPRSVPKDFTQNVFPPSPTSISSDSLRSAQIAASTDFSRSLSSSTHQGSPGSDKRQSFAALSTATAVAAKKWGLGVLQRNVDKRTALDHANDHSHGNPSQPMGRGRPLPPPGMPLPPPENRTKPKPPPLSPSSTKTLPKTLRNQGRATSTATKHRNASREMISGEGEEEHIGQSNLLVVAAPAVESEPTTPSPSEDAAHGFAQQMDMEESAPASGEHQHEDSHKHTPRMPSISSTASNHSVDDTGGNSWESAQEEDVRSRNVWSEVEGGHS